MSLRNAGLDWPQGMDLKTAPKIFGFALKGLPVKALKETIAKIIRGDVEGITKFMPPPPQLAAMVRAEARPLVEARARARETLDAYERRAPEPEKTPEAVERVRALVAGVKQAARDQRENAGRGVQPEIPLTFDQAERYRKMMALPDAPEITAEHMAYRRRISAKIETADQFPSHDEPVQGGYFKALQQQEEMENHGNKAQGGFEGEDRGGDADRFEGREERTGGDDEF